MLTNCREQLRDAGSVLGGRRSWSTRKVEQRIGFTLFAGCRKDDDLEIDYPAFLSGAVLVDVEIAALCSALDALDLTVCQNDGFCRTLAHGARGMKAYHEP